MFVHSRRLSDNFEKRLIRKFHKRAKWLNFWPRQAFFLAERSIRRQTGLHWLTLAL